LSPFFGANGSFLIGQERKPEAHTPLVLWV